MKFILDTADTLAEKQWANARSYRAHLLMTGEKGKTYGPPPEKNKAGSVCCLHTPA